MYEIPPTIEQIREWKEIYKKYRPELIPNKKTAKDLIFYLNMRYPIEEVESEEMKQAIVDTIKANRIYAKKCPMGRKLNVIVYRIPNQGEAAYLYEHQKREWKDMPIMVGIELETAYMTVKGSTELWEELVAFQGLDQEDMKSYYLVANYIKCLKKYNADGDILL